MKAQRSAGRVFLDLCRGRVNSEGVRTELEPSGGSGGHQKKTVQSPLVRM